MGMASRRGPVVPSFDPRSVPGLELWLDARWPAGFGVAPPADGTVLASWADLSGNGRNAVQATAARQPLYRTAAVITPTGYPVVQFDGADDCLINQTATAGQPLTIYGVAAKDRSLSTRYVDGGGGGDRAILGEEDGVYFLYAGVGVQAATGAPIGAYRVLTATYDAASSHLRDGGVQVLAGNPGLGGLANGFTIGADHGGGAHALQGKIAAVLVYTGAHDDPTRQRIERHLGRLAGISIAAS